MRSLMYLNNFKRYLFLRSARRIKDDPSQLSEAQIIQLLLKNLANQGIMAPSTFLEIGAKYPFYLSTSWYLEHTLGFNGISVDPIARFKNSYKWLRPSTKFMNYIVVDRLSQKSEKDFFEASADVFSTSDINECLKREKTGVSFKKYKCESVDYSHLSLLMNHEIGVLIMDIESTKQQLAILEDIIISKEKLPHIICVEMLEFLGGNDCTNRKDLYDIILDKNYTMAASTFLNSIYTLNSPC